MEDFAGDERPFAVLYRPNIDAHNVELLRGDVVGMNRLDELAKALERSDVLALLPFRQIKERGMVCNDDGMPLLAMQLKVRERIGRAQLLEMLPSEPVDWSDFEFDITDEQYCRIVQAVVHNEIGAGEGSNFVVARSLIGSFGAEPGRTARQVFRHLLAHEADAYWTYLIYTGRWWFVGATPEAHVGLRDNTVFMNPISGTYRYPDCGPTAAGLRQFLNDQKEIDELFMVVDEELKMMSRVCPEGGIVSGPNLKCMSHLAHTEYMIHGVAAVPPTTLLRETLFAPTVMGSPLENASRVIARQESVGRGYYSGVAALIERAPDGNHRMDSAIIIRTAVVDETGAARITVGSTLVRDSEPQREADETRAKAAALVSGHPGKPLSGCSDQDSSGVAELLARRNALASPFWLDPTLRRGCAREIAVGKTVLLIDAEDYFTAMLATMLRALGVRVTITAIDSEPTFSGFDVVVFGPGPGDPKARHDSRVSALRKAILRGLFSDTPFLAVCLSHQILCDIIGLPICHLERPNQGVGRDINLFGRTVRAGFYNTFVARSTADELEAVIAGRVEVSRDPSSEEIYALRGARFESFQFHAESVLSRDGWPVLSAALERLLHAQVVPADSDRQRSSA
ncbi:hypothetical protein A5782_17195 [Mycobacterium sp. 852002-40037_SCH5390672]|nr:hypothetical protein A5782_17195 [Mycobacterium sp. 852002-40037_SCH5390672]